MKSEPETLDPIEDTPPRKRKRRWAKRLGWLLAALLAPLLLAALLLSTPIGKRFITDQIADVAPASGLRFTVGRIEGDIYGASRLYDVTLSDPLGPFATIPEVRLNWNPLAWLTSGLDIRELTARRAKVSRLPELLPGDPEAPLLPDFDIRVDSLAIEDLTLEAGVLTESAEKVNLNAEVDIRRGRVLVDASGQLGREDEVVLRVLAEPDGDAFDMALDYRAAADGVLAKLTGASSPYRARLDGDGGWSEWTGHLLVKSKDERVAGFRVTNQEGNYRALGMVTPRQSNTGIIARAFASGAAIDLQGTLQESVLDGTASWVSDAITMRGEGAIDLAGNRFDGFDVSAVLRNPNLVAQSFSLDGARIEARLDGAFRDLSIRHDVTVQSLSSGSFTARALTQSGTAQFDGERFDLPLDLEMASAESGVEYLDNLLRQGRASGTLSLAGSRIRGERIQVNLPDARSQIDLTGDLASGTFDLSGPISVQGLPVDGVGSANAVAKFRLRLAQGDWRLASNFDAALVADANPTFANAIGEEISLTGSTIWGSTAPLSLENVVAQSDKLSLELSGQLVDGALAFEGAGDHSDYGPLEIAGSVGTSGPELALNLQSPLPALGMVDVQVAIVPADNGYAITTSGQSLVGPFDGEMSFVSKAGSDPRLEIEQLTVSQSQLSGALAFGTAGTAGELSMTGGGLDGAIRLQPTRGGQAYQIDITASDARFNGETTLYLSNAQISANGLLAEGRNRLNAEIQGRGLSYGSTQIGRFAAKTDLTDGRGKITAALTGRQSGRLRLEFDANVSPDQIGILARGEIAGRELVMAKRARLTALDDGGWRLAPSRIDIGSGSLLAEGELGGERTLVDVKALDLPLSLSDLFLADLGLGGTVSGLVEYRAIGAGAPSGRARLQVKDLTRSGLVLTSRPLDMAVVADLNSSRFNLRGQLRDDSTRVGSIDLTVSGLPGGQELFSRLQRGALTGTVRYQGQADALWRLAAVEGFDLTGPVGLVARARGTLADPVIRGDVASDSLRVRSTLTGTDVRDVSVRGQFDGAELKLSRFAGLASNGGRVSGSGLIGLTDVSASRGPTLDLRIATDGAELLDTGGLSATVTGPLRIISNGNGGTIAGRVSVDRASWRLGTAAEELQLPNIETREINQRDGQQVTAANARPWRYLIDATADNRFQVDGLGLESEWSADVIIRGTTLDPRIGGEARVVRGAYSFAGTRFELTRGRIEFDENVPVDPRLDILAETEQNGLDVTVSVRGNALQPQIGFTSNPALPEEEILSRLLFGDSITSLSATDALQLGTALASLRGGSGIDPINRLRSAIGLDRLRIVAADPALDRGTGVALGKNLGQKFYVEIVTDGRGYSATSVEFRLTGWLSLLGSVSTIGRESVVAEVSRDY